MSQRALLVRNARIWSGGGLLEADSVLLAHSRIVAVGCALESHPEAREARVLEACGATVTPGLCDAHLHFVPWALSRRQPDLRGALTRSEALARVREGLASDRGSAPLVGRGWDESSWDVPPDRASLDALAPDRPVILHRHDFHSLWVNSAALAAAGVSRESADPEGGRFDRTPSGEPTGLIREQAVRAFDALELAAGPVVDDALLDDAAGALHAAGITMVHDYQRDAVDLRRMQALSRRRRLRVLQMFGPESCDGLLAAGLTSGTGDAWFRIGSLKLFADGTLGSRTAAMLEPYEDAGGLGMAMYAPAELREIVRRAVSAGISVSIHAIGDRAVREALDAFEACGRALLEALPLPPRIEHVQLLHPQDLPRFALLGVAASMQPQHCVTDAESARVAWGRRCAWSYPWRSLLASGATLAFGSDAPVEPASPSLGLHAALTRRRADTLPQGEFEPQECLTLDQALAAYTIGASRLAAMERRLGVLRVGAQGDLVVWDRDLHAAPAGDLPTLRPAWTVLGGEIVYESPDLGRIFGSGVRGRHEA
ncbi:MAG: amidohydrolase [Candidatus Eisenbacteria bacterium]